MDLAGALARIVHWPSVISVNGNNMSRLDHIRRLYDVLSRLEEQVGGKRLLSQFGQYRDWPQRGVYFFFEPQEFRSDSGEDLRVVRVGTHALKQGSRSTLGKRLSQHRGKVKGGGNHRGSIFRLLVGQAMIGQGTVPPCPSWGVKGDLSKVGTALRVDRKAIHNSEQPVEGAVSRYIGAMPFLWLDIDDVPSPDSLRGYIERNAIALLSNYERPPLDMASANWLGQHSNRSLVQKSQLWNQRHVSEVHDPELLPVMRRLVERMGP